MLTVGMKVGHSVQHLGDEISGIRLIVVATLSDPGRAANEMQARALHKPQSPPIHLQATDTQARTR